MSVIFSLFEFLYSGSNCDNLDNWLRGDVEMSDNEEKELVRLQNKLRKNVDIWNEQELIIKFIALIIDKIDYQECFNTYLYAHNIHTTIHNHNEPSLAYKTASEMKLIYDILQSQNFSESSDYIKGLKVKRLNQIKYYTCYDHRQLMKSIYTYRYNLEKALQQYVMFTSSIPEFRVLMNTISKMTRTAINNIHTNAKDEGLLVTDLELILFSKDLELKHQKNNKLEKAKKKLETAKKKQQRYH